MMRAHVGERLDVVDQRRRRVVVVAGPGHLDVRGQTAAGVDVGRRLDDLAHAAPVRRRDARERVAAVDRLEQRGLLAVEVLVRALEDVDLDAVAPNPRALISAIAARSRVDLGREATASSRR